MAEGYKWKPFSDLPADPRSLTDSELEPLLRVWTEQRSMLESQGVLEVFNTRLSREWAIETGLIEGVYKLDRGITETLIEHGISASFIRADGNEKSPDQIARILQDHVEALEGMFAFVKGDRELTVGYIKTLHAALLRNVHTVTVVNQFGEFFETALEKGKYKTLPNSPKKPDGTIHEYCPPEHVASEMDRMVALHQEHSRMSVPVEVEAAWLHHVFTQIHPFQDGNGRVARAIATLVFIKAGWFPLVVTSRDDKVKYIDALEIADVGDLRPLVSLCTTIQRKTLVRASHIVSEIKPPLTAEEAIAAARDLLIANGKIGPKEWMHAKDMARVLNNVALERLRKVVERLGQEIGRIRPDFKFVLNFGEQRIGLPFDSTEIVAAGTALGYAANVADHHEWSFLSLETPVAAGIFLTIHTISPNFHGLLAALVLFRAEGKTVVVNNDLFQINYREDSNAAQQRFRAWFERQIATALTLWRQTL